LKLFLSFILLSVSLFASDKYTLRASMGKVTLSDFSEIIIGNWQKHPFNLKVYSLDGGYLLSKNYSNLGIDFYGRGSLSYYDEDHRQDDIYEAALYFKAYWNFLNERVRFGFGEGISYTSGVLVTERLEASQEGDNNSKFLNYLDVSLDVDIGTVFANKELDALYIGWALKHRSGIFGLINDVKRGGSNYNCVYIEKKF